ncbi:MarR family winged helix-turn-helix transcriptional regulator [Bacillus sp. S/N-304-OC-R1]|uniref:MarR family winged helix-turn-helix transcriptional regulator n=1 Tax=Bacillus sp. S/N-304-OC-R1 TaxID=2758034 RepID=UPI001C8CF78C|nr:MarR family transcriptional regulator [Bacillus sp. S/N-304-OC-R1]MBY0122952.1 MarR family transcriptional regulator [Bacillus sp. S/N-304-OC-R1]
MNNISNNLFHSINQFTRHFSKILNEALVPLGLYSAQWTIVYLLKTNGSSTQKELSLYLGVEAPTMTRTLARMEKSGWITKEIGTDKREKQIILTEKSNEMYDKWLEAVRACEAKVLQNIPEQEMVNMLSIISKMNASL